LIAESALFLRAETQSISCYVVLVWPKMINFQYDPAKQLDHIYIQYFLFTVHNMSAASFWIYSLDR